jgi:hypothetical protein
MTPPVRTRGDVRRLIQRADTAVSLLRTRGHKVASTGEREVLADLLEALALIARRRLDPHYEPEPDVDHSGADIVTDLFAPTEGQ